MLRQAAAAAIGFMALMRVASSSMPIELDATSTTPASYPYPSTRPASVPNVIVVMTDDQDKIMSVDIAMPNVVNKIGRQGMTYDKHFCTVAWCCPSRVNFFTGKAAHNTNVTSIAPPYGGWSKFIEEGLNEEWLPVWLQNEGIETYYVGKLMNGYNTSNYDDQHRPKGWTRSNFLVDPFTYYYHNATFTKDDGDGLENYLDIHTTDITQKKALQLLHHATQSEKPFFLMVAPIAPHVQGNGGGGPIPPSPPEFKLKFEGEMVPDTPNFNPVERSGASWVHNLKRLDKAALDFGHELHQNRLRNIAGVDRMVGTMIDALEASGRLDNTYMIFTTDNGFHIGQHRLHPGKRCGYEEDINIPLYIRGPDVAVNQTSAIFNSHTDMAPTILKMFNIPFDNPKYHFDGSPIPYTPEELSDGETPNSKKELITIEFWDSSVHNPGKLSKRSADDAQIQLPHPTGNEEDHHDGDLQPGGTNYGNTYKSLRMRSGNESFYYSVWCSGKFKKGEGDHEFYDMTTDAQQMHNLYYPRADTQYPRTYFSRPLVRLLHRLDALLLVLKSCRESTCRNPWTKLFPRGEVDSLEQAMAEPYDMFFEGQPRVRFAGCARGYFADGEGVQEGNVYGGEYGPASALSSTGKTAGIVEGSEGASLRGEAVATVVVTEEDVMVVTVTVAPLAGE